MCLTENTSEANLLRASQIPRCSQKSLHVVVGVGTATQAGAHEAQAATHEGQTEQDVDQGGGPEGKQVQGLVAVEVWVCCIFLVAGLINRIDPHITSNKPAENKEGCH